MALSEGKKIGIAKWIDEVLGAVLVRLLARLPRRAGAPSRGAASVRKVLFIKFWGMGSIVLSEPALRSLRDQFPEAELHYLTLRRNRALFTLMPHVDVVLTLPFAGFPSFLATLAGILHRLRREAYDVVYDGEFFVNFSGLLAWISGAPRIVGFARPEGAKRRLQDVCVPFLANAHTARQYLNLVAGMATSDRDPPRPRLRDPETVPLPAPGARRPHLVLNVNASPLALERRWDRERFVALGKAILARFEGDLILIGCRGETEYVGAVEAGLACPERVRNLCGALTLPQLAWWLRGAVALISNDSGPVHLASAYDVPTVALFGPETPVRYGPLSGRRLALYEKLWCSPCMSVENAKTVRCVNGLACMKGLRTDRVIAAVEAFVSGLGEASGARPRKAGAGS